MEDEQTDTVRRNRNGEDRKMDEGGKRKVMIDANVTLNVKKGRNGKGNKKRELGDTHNKSQIWADAPHCRVPTLATQHTYTLYTPCDIMMTERVVMCIVQWLDGRLFRC